MGNTEAVYEKIESEVFEDVEIVDNRDYDCVLVFDMGSSTKDWKAPADGGELQYEYIKTLDNCDREQRKELFPQHGADFAPRVQTKEKDFFKNERKLVIKALTKLRVKCKRISAMTKEFEDDKNLRFYYVGIGEKTARDFAHKIEYELELDPQSAISYLQLMGEPLACATFDDGHESEDCIEKNWKNVYIKYEKHVAPEMYKPYDVLDSEDQKQGYEDSLFRIRDRLALLYEIVSQDVEMGGCGIRVAQLQMKEHCIVDFYPLHTLEHLQCVLDQLFSLKALTYDLLRLPLEEIRSYFGEYIGIYFAYLEFMTVYFLPLSLLGFVLQCMQWIEGVVLVEGIQYFALIVILWSVLFPILWKRKEYEWALKWGTLRFDLSERPRPEFSGYYRHSNIDGTYEEYFPRHIRNSRRLINFGVVIAFFTALFGAVMAVILLRIYVADNDLTYGSYFISVANALVIMFFNNIYGILAEKLNKWENYKTETEYENNLIFKIFIFRFINSYTTLYYYVFVRRYETDASLYCSAEECMEDCMSQLAIIFLTQLTVSNAIELGTLFAARCAKGQALSYFTADEKDSIWAQYSSEIYERTFDDYCEILVSFGYATLFVISFPLAPLAAFVGCIVEARIDGYKLCKLTRRPFPRQADDVGTWQLAMECMGWAVLVTNLAIICFSADDLEISFGVSDSSFAEVLTAMLLFVILAFIVVVMNYCIASKPIKIEMHQTRQDHLEKQCKELGANIDKYLDGLNYEKELKNWKKWKPRQVCYFLREVCYKNPEEYNKLKNEIIDSEFGGKEFDECDEHTLERKLLIEDHLHKRFILNARRVLEEQCEIAKEQSKLMDEFDPYATESAGHSRRGSTTEIGSAQQTGAFQFTVDNLIQMAEFFEEDLTGQSKRKLWSKVDKDESSLIEQDEMENFLYFSIIVFIKAKLTHVKKLPKKTDKRFKNDILAPLENWIVRHKMSDHGLTFDEFERFFPSWLREYYRESSANESGVGIDVLHLQAKVSSNKPKSKKLGNFFGVSGGGLFGTRDRAETAETAEMSEFKFENVDRQDWSQESLDFELKLDSVAHAINKTDPVTRGKIWDKFDRKNVERLDCDKSLSRVVYSLIALYIKTKGRDSKPPKFNLLQPLLQSICDEIKLMINSASGDDDNIFISKHDFITHISTYLKKIATHRKLQRKDIQSSSKHGGQKRK